MITPCDEKAIKVAGYLEKKSKMKVVNRWKKMWFVLDGRLLLYYKSQVEYRSLSPCRGTVNMGLAANVVPGKSNEIIISTRSHTVSLRALNRAEHDVWLQALIDAMFLPKSHAVNNTKPVQHFRYSSGDINGKISTLDVNKNQKTDILTNIPTSVSRKPSQMNKTKSKDTDNHKYICDKLDLENNNNCSNFENKLVTAANRASLCMKDYKLDKMNKKFSKIAVSDSSIPGRFTVTSNENIDSCFLRRSASMENDLLTLTDNIYESVKDSFYSDAREIIKRERLKRSDSDCLFLNRTRPMVKHEFRSEERLRRDDYSMRKNLARQLEPSLVPQELRVERKPPRRGSSLLVGMHKEIKSDTDLTLRKPVFQSGSCGTLWFNRPRHPEPDRHCSLTSSNISNAGSAIPPDLPDSIITPTKKRSASFLRRFSRDDDKQNNNKEKPTSKKRSMSFLRRIWKKREKKWDDDSIHFHINPLIGKNLRHYDYSDYDHFSGSDHLEYCIPQPEPPPDYDEVNVSSGSESDLRGPELPPRQRDKSPWHDVPKNNRSVREDMVKCSWDDMPKRTSKEFAKGSWNDIPKRTAKEDMVKCSWDNVPKRTSTEDMMKCSWDDVPKRTAKEDSVKRSWENTTKKAVRAESPWADSWDGWEDVLLASEWDRPRGPSPWDDNPSDWNNSPWKDSHSDWSDTPKVSSSASTITPKPSLPSKRRDFVLHHTEPEWCESAAALRALFQEDFKTPTPPDLDNMLLQLQEINSTPLQSLHSDTMEAEPDYDVPRPHASLLKNLSRRSTTSDTLPATHFLANYHDSLDPKLSRKSYEELVMAPDSLECDPWSLASDVDSQNDSWATYAPLARSVLYQDSLNPILKT